MEDKEKRIACAVANFKEGYNCAQSVAAAFADLYGLSREQALLAASSFGGGIGRMRLTCGAACGMFMLAGLETGTSDAKDRAGKSHNYEVVQKLAAAFKAENGSLACAELLGLDRRAPVSSEAEPRTESYYAKRPCAMMVESAARIFADFLEENGH